VVTTRHRFLIPGIVPLAVVSLLAFQAARRAPDTAGPLSDPFAAGWILTDTNGDGIIDFVAGKVVVPAQPTAVENAAAADIAARLGFATTGLTPPIVIGAADDRNDGPRIWIGRGAVPSQYLADADRNAARLDAEEGGVFAIGGGLAVFGRDDAGLLAAAEAFAARAPFLWKTPGDRLSAIGDAIEQATPGATPRIAGITYLKGKSGVNRALVDVQTDITSAVLDTALKSGRLLFVHQLIARKNGAEVTATSTQPLPAIPALPVEAAAEAGAAGGGGAGGGAAEGGPQGHSA
jgi:hypothetical protein